MCFHRGKCSEAEITHNSIKFFSFKKIEIFIQTNKNMDPSKISFLQNVLRYTTSHTDGTTPQEPNNREMSPEVLHCLYFF